MESTYSFGSSSTHNEEEEVILASDRPKRSAGRKKFTETRHPVYRNIRRRKNDKWVCEVREPNKKSRLWLGTYDTAEMAARAYDVAAIALRGKSACLNFADSVWRLPRPGSLDPKDIRKAAAEAAEMFAPNVRTNSTMEEDWTPSNENQGFFDEEAVFEMAGLMEDMAEGLLLPPPSSYIGNENGWGDDEENGGEVPLWSFSL